MDKSPLRIIFMGTPDFASATLEALLSGPDEVVAVVSQPDKKKGRGKKLSPTPVKIVAEQNNIPVLQPTKIKTEEFLSELASFRPDVLVVAAYGRILPPSILKLAPHGCINVHGSLLPKYRGAAPIQWAVINGEKEVGVTIMQMDEGMDTGDILHTAIIEPTEDETAGSLFNKLAALGGPALLDALQLLKNGALQAIPQEHSIATHAPMLKKDDGLIDWNLKASVIHCHIRGLDPWPSAYCFLEGKRVRLFKPEVVHIDSPKLPGTVLSADKNGLTITTGENCIRIKELQPEGKRRMQVQDFINGRPIAPGTSLAQVVSSGDES